MITALNDRAPLAVCVVWIDMRAADNDQEARRQAERMPDPRITHFHDPGRRAGRAFSEAIGGRNHIAWDIYLVYRAGVLWGEAAPRPQAWVHQLSGALWANPFRYRTGAALKRELERLVLAEINPGTAGS